MEHTKIVTWRRRLEELDDQKEKAFRGNYCDFSTQHVYSTLLDTRGD